MDHKVSSPHSSRHHHNDVPESYGVWRLIDHQRRRKGRSLHSMILYLSIVALFVILLLNHRSIHRYVDPSVRQLSSSRSRSAVRSASNANKIMNTHNKKGKHSRDSQRHNQQHHHHHHSNTLSTEDTHSLRVEFENWVKHHKRNYGSKEETEKRWLIWKDNHFRTVQKNLLHGPCKHTQKHVFGSNHFKDLSPEEFRTKYLTGYGGPTSVDSTNMYLTHQHPLSSSHSRHESVHQRYLNHIQNVTWFQPKSRSLYNNSPLQYFSANTTTPCSWYQVNCWLQSMVGKYSDTVSSFGKHREPTFNASSYPTSTFFF